MSHHVRWLGIIGCLCNVVLLKLWLLDLHVSLRLLSWCSLMPQYLSESGTMTHIMPRPSQIRIRRFWCSVCQLYFKSLESVWSFKANLMCFMVCISSTWRWNPAYCNSLLPPLDLLNWSRIGYRCEALYLLWNLELFLHVIWFRAVISSAYAPGLLPTFVFK